MTYVQRNRLRDYTLYTDAQGRDAFAFHQAMKGYRPTPLYEVEGIADRLGVGRLFVKDESQRFSLPSFKVLGASWAIARKLAVIAGDDRVLTFDELRKKSGTLGDGYILTAATDGNHGRAVARIARMLGMQASIYVPKATASARISAILEEEATVTIVDGSYEAAVERAAESASERTIVISDTAWPGYADVPTWVIDGYGTILLEVEQQLSDVGAGPIDIVAVQIGVGALAAAVVRHYRRADVAPTAILGVEPVGAACMLASLRAGSVKSVAGPHSSIMAGLNCDTPSAIAWPIVSRGIDAVIAIEDEVARQAIQLLARFKIVSGESGAAGLAGLLEVSRLSTPISSLLTLGSEKQVLVIVSEGATDPDSYAKIVGLSAP